MTHRGVQKMYKFKIEKISVNSTDGVQNIVPKKINILVGPNNSGKSRLLKEIRDYLSGDHNDLKILSEVSFAFPNSFSEFNTAYNVESKMFQDSYGNWLLKVYSNKPGQPWDMSTNLENYFTRNINSFGGNWQENCEDIIQRHDSRDFFYWYGALFFQYLGTEERLTICKKQKNYGMDTNGTNYLTSFKYQNKLLQELTCKVKQLFHKDIYLDSQTLGDRLAFRVGENFDYFRNVTTPDETEARTLFSETLLDDQGDGLKSFVSTFLSLNLGESDILLLDEPEAFLHPPLARQLGEMIGEFHDEDKTVFISTHSVEILKGILSKNQDVNVIRITQPKPKINEIRVLNQEVLNTILRNPLLRVSRILEGIFCERVVITESEADELVYQELIEKIFPESGLFFAHGQNKQTLATIAELYKEIGIAFEIITDFDVLRKPGEFLKFLRLMPIEERERSKLQNYANTLRNEVTNSVDITGLSEDEIEKKQSKKRDEVYHEYGIRYFDADKQKKLESSLRRLASFHLHIVKTGELETLLEDYGISYQAKSIWIVAAINEIAELKREDIPQDGSLYCFLDRVVNGGDATS